MHSNFITPPDYVETVLVVDATEVEIRACGDACQLSGRPFNVYFYNGNMNNLDWLSRIVRIADKILQAEVSDVPVLRSEKFGPNQYLKFPSEYFNK